MYSQGIHLVARSGWLLHKFDPFSPQQVGSSLIPDLTIGSLWDEFKIVQRFSQKSSQIQSEASPNQLESRIINDEKSVKR